ncbi:MAG: undecaprenyldiphospho-muramoylpentapeptide beta-N-acetylglucosaminyltransferase [Thermacetogeniaceae bacterium]
MRVMLTGGGTGGHLYPALAVAGLLRKMDPDGEILFVGTGEGLESSVVPKEGYSFCQIAAGKWPRKISVDGIKSLFLLGKGFIQGIRLIKQFKPDAVLATGGYVSVPLGVAAAVLGVPLLLHEQNSVPGMANKLLSRWAEVLFTTFPLDKGSFSSRAKIIHVGLPVRPEILNVRREDGINFFGFEADRLTVLVTGGSRGARCLNQVLLEVYEEIHNDGSFPPLQIIHLTGRTEYQQVCHHMAKKGLTTEKFGKIVIKPYLEEMEYALAAADLVISRAGAATLAELTARGIPAVLIPYPYATDNHQYHNARFLKDRGAAVLIPEGELTANRLFGELRELIGNVQLREKMAEQSRKIGRPQAGEYIAEYLLGVGKKSHCTSPVGKT